MEDAFFSPVLLWALCCSHRNGAIINGTVAWPNTWIRLLLWQGAQQKKVKQSRRHSALAPAECANPPFKTAVIRDVMQKAQRKLYRLTERPKRSRSLPLPPQVSKAAGVSSPLLWTTAPCCWRLRAAVSTSGPGAPPLLSTPRTSQPAPVSP